jgi:uncharacterized protein YcsI (UPF0317 family)
LPITQSGCSSCSFVVSVTDGVTPQNVTVNVPVGRLLSHRPADFLSQTQPG